MHTSNTRSTSRVRARTRWVAAACATTLLTALVAAAPSASASGKSSEPGTRSLVDVLGKDGTSFDRKRFDYDIVEAAAFAVLANDETSPVGLLADGTVALTAFLPNDRAFRMLANDLLGYEKRSEAQVFGDLAGALGVETIEAVLLYHVVPGATIDYRTALRSDGASLATALEGASLTVDVKKCKWLRQVRLVDADPDSINARVVQPNINKGNLQIAHGVSRVLRPLDL